MLGSLLCLALACRCGSRLTDLDRTRRGAVLPHARQTCALEAQTAARIATETSPLLDEVVHAGLETSAG